MLTNTMKQYQRYYLVSTPDKSLYIKLDSDLPFSILEGKENLKEKYPDAVKIIHLSPRKAKQYLNLDK